MLRSDATAMKILREWTNIYSEIDTAFKKYTHFYKSIFYKILDAENGPKLKIS